MKTQIAVDVSVRDEAGAVLPVRAVKGADAEIVVTVGLPEALAEALASWFHKRDELFDARESGECAVADVRDLLAGLVDIGDEVVAALAPDTSARCRVTGERQ